MIFGSVMLSAKAMAEPSTTAKLLHRSEKFSSRFSCSPKEFSLGNLSPAFGECGEVSLFISKGQAETRASQKKLYEPCKLLRIAAFTVQVMHVQHILHKAHEICAPVQNKKAGARRLRLSSWLCARIKTKLEFEASAPNAAHCERCQLYALRRGRTVKSRTCARMLDICIPFSCETYGRTSATN